MSVNILRYLIGNPNAYAVQQKDGSYRPVRDPLTADILRDHLDGHITVGTYVLNFDKARTIVFDIDDGDRALALKLAAACKGFGLTPSIEFSGRKGYHVWVVLEQYEPAADVQRLAKTIAAQVGFNGEVFPKQATARDLGNLVKLPFGVHQVTGTRSSFVGGMPYRTSHERFVSAMSRVGSAPAPLHGKAVAYGPLPCMESIQTNPPVEGERNRSMFHFATMLRRGGLTDPFVETVLRELNQRVGLDEYELEAIIRNSATSGPSCGQLSPERQCGERCVKDRPAKFLSLRPGQVRQAADGELVVVEVRRANAGDRVVEFQHPDITQSKAALAEQRDGS